MSISSSAANAETESCPAHPATLTEMRDCYRPLLIFAGSSIDDRLTQQLKNLGVDAPALSERDVRVVVLTPDKVTQFSESEQAKLRTRFKIPADRFAVLLIGKDGGEKMRSATPVTVQDLNRKIDSMPMRQQEMKPPSR